MDSLKNVLDKLEGEKTKSLTYRIPESIRGVIAEYQNAFAEANQAKQPNQHRVITLMLAMAVPAMDKRIGALRKIAERRKENGEPFY